MPEASRCFNIYHGEEDYNYFVKKTSKQDRSGSCSYITDYDSHPNFPAWPVKNDCYQITINQTWNTNPVHA